MTQSDTHTVVVGGGVIGVCCAYYLAKRGARVTVFDRDRIGRGASFGNAGTIAPGHAPITRPGRVARAIGQLLDPTSPLYIPLRWDPALARWLAAFWANCTPSRVRSCMRVLEPLGHVTIALFERLVAEEAVECGYRRDGYYEVYRTKRGLEEALREAALVREHGYHPLAVTGELLREREPAFAEEIVGGVFYPEAATCDPHRFVLEVADRVRRHGGVFHTGRDIARVVSDHHRIRGVQTADGEIIAADRVILATGAYSQSLLRPFGLRLPIQAGKGYHRDCDVAMGGVPGLAVTCMLGEQSVFCTPLGSVVRFAGTIEFSGVNHDMHQARLEQLTGAAGHYLLGADAAAVRSEWCGLRPCTPDGLPVVGPVSGHPGLYVANGHAMLGLTLGPITGKLVSECVLDGVPSIDINALAPGRFRRRGRRGRHR